jgi:hypothetical protein
MMKAHLFPVHSSTGHADTLLINDIFTHTRARKALAIVIAITSEEKIGLGDAMSVHQRTFELHSYVDHEHDPFSPKGWYSSRPRSITNPSVAHSR